MDYCPLHSELATEKGMSQAQFVKLFNDHSGGFRVAFDGVPDSKLMLSWYDVVDSARDFMFFGMPHSSNRPMDYLFYRKTTLQWCHHILRHFADQYYGDSTQSALLLAAYHKARALIHENNEKAALAREAGLFDCQTLLTDEGKQFVNVFNKHCKFAFYHSVTSFQQYSLPLILVEDWENFIDRAKFVFEKPWRLLMSFRGRKSTDSQELIRYKERQVLCQILSLIRASNPRYLTYWSLIITTAYYGWGVRGTAILATSFWGITCSRRTRDRMYTEFMSKIDTVRRAVLRHQSVGLVCFDNIVVVNSLMCQRGRASKVLTATHMVGHMPIIFTDISFDNQYAALTFDKYQPSSSPVDMYIYKDHCWTSVTLGTDVFIRHNDLPQLSEPDFSGQNVKSYRQFSRLADEISHFGHTFRRSDDCYKNIPDCFDDTILFQLRQLSAKKQSKELFDLCHYFKRDSVRSWNTAAASTTLSLLLGVVGIDEGSAEGAMTCVLDLLLKYDILRESDDGSWIKVKSFPKQEMMCYCDRTTNENVAAYILSLQNRPMSLEEASLQSEIYLDSVTDTMFLPGDWHTSLNMLQSIYKLHWDRLLCPLKEMLKWKRISKDIRGCYYQASKLVTLANRAFKSYLMMAYFSGDSDRVQTILDSENEDANKVVEIVKAFQLWQLSCKYAAGGDEHLQMIANFILVSDDFIDFVDSIRKRDSIGIEDGYQCFVPVWRMLGQTKYLQTYIEQIILNNKDFPYHRRMTQLLSRTVRTYNENTGKSAVAHDEFLEVNNRDLSLMPSVRTLDGRIRQGYLVGVSRRCKRVFEVYFDRGNGDLTTKVNHHSSGIKGNHHLEKDLLFELAGLFLGDLFKEKLKDRKRSIDKDSVWSLQDKITTDLHRDKLAKEMRNNIDDETSRLFNSVTHLRQAARMSVEPDDEDDLPHGIGIDDDEDAESEMDSLQINTVVDERNEVDDTDDVFSKNCIKDIWFHGWDMIDKMKIKEMNERKAKRIERKRKTQNIILKKVKELKENAAASVVIDDESFEGIDAPWTAVVHNLDSDRYVDH